MTGTASYASNGGVTQLIAGSNITLSPSNGKGQVTISSTGGGGIYGNTATGSYGSFYDTTIQSLALANSVYSMSLDTTDISNGVSISGSTNPYNTYIKMANAGVYDIQFSAQVDKTTGTNAVVYIWLRKNGVDLAETNTAVTLAGGANDKATAAWNWFVNAAAGDYFQLMWAGTNNNVRLFATGSGIIDAAPAIPSLIVTANRVDQFLSNTGSFSGSFTGVFTGSLIGTSSWATNALTASYANTLDGLDSTQFARLDIDNTFNGVNTTTQKTLRTNGAYVIAEALYASPTITGPDTQSIELFNIYDYVAYSADRPIANTAAIFNYTILDPNSASIRSGQINLSWSPGGNPSEAAITETQTIVNSGESSNISFDYIIDYSTGAEYVKLRVLNGSTTDIYVRGFLRII